MKSGQFLKKNLNTKTFDNYFYFYKLFFNKYVYVSFEEMNICSMTKQHFDMISRLQ